MLEKIKQTLRSFMTGRYGADQLSSALLWAGVVLYVLEMFLGTGALTIAGAAVFALAGLRMLSRNHDRRALENRRFLNLTDKALRGVRQGRARFANRKEYKYFRCPGCRSWIRLRRGAGSVTVRCGKCQTSFDQKA